MICHLFDLFVCRCQIRNHRHMTARLIGCIYPIRRIFDRHALLRLSPDLITGIEIHIRPWFSQFHHRCTDDLIKQIFKSDHFQITHSPVFRCSRHNCRLITTSFQFPDRLFHIRLLLNSKSLNMCTHQLLSAPSELVVWKILSKNITSFALLQIQTHSCGICRPFPDPAGILLPALPFVCILPDISLYRSGCHPYQKVLLSSCPPIAYFILQKRLLSISYHSL